MDHADRFERLFAAHRSAVARMAAAFESDADDRDDLIQEIAVAVWRALPTFRGDCSERTFLLRIAYNRGLTHRWRRTRRRHTTLQTAADLPDPRPDPATQAERSQGYDRLLAAVRRLPESLRGVTMLRLEDLSLGEIAEVLGVSENAATVRLSRARALLREYLSPEGSDETT